MRLAFWFMSSLVAHLLFGSVGSSTEVPREAIQAVETRTAALKSGLYVEYTVDQKLVRDGERVYLHVASPGKAKSGWAVKWTSEHAIRGNQYRHRTCVGAELDTNEGLIVSDGENAYVHSALTKIVKVFPAAACLEKPQEMLYWELLGYESPGQDKLTTLRGFRDPNPYDIGQVLKLEGYSVESSGGLVVLKKPLVDEIWLDPAKGWCIVKRVRNWVDTDLPMITFEVKEFARFERRCRSRR